MRVLGTVLVVVAAMLVGASTAQAASTVSARVQGFEYAATATEGRFGGASLAPLPGAWTATVVHEPLRPGRAVPITDGRFRLYGRHGSVDGGFVGGSVTPRRSSVSCGNERFDVAGTLALRDGGRGSVRVVLTHLRTPTRSGCRTYGATVSGTVTVPARGALA